MGFRPFVYRTAVDLALNGYVSNDSLGVLIEAEGAPADLDELCRRLVDDAPPLARVATVAAERITPTADTGGFTIVSSSDRGAPNVPVSVDVGPCDDCLAELDDPADRRYGYPFINCTNCGPRYTITRRIPYDRPLTTMASFTLCARCQAEYDDPGDRRFHAQPNACPDCGPELILTDPAGVPQAKGADALDLTLHHLAQGRIVAIKGVGGYHLAVDAADAAAVGELRRRKARDDKPFALLVTDLDGARVVCHLDAHAESELACPRRPIVLATRRRDAPVADAVAPGLPELGVMLPPSPLHHLIAARFGSPLVLTSGNLSDEPIAHDDDDALARLGPLVDAVLSHDRAIHIRCDDSVVRAGVDGRLQPIRRSRGYAPEPLTLPSPTQRHVLAVGAELKNTVAVAKAAAVVASHHIGDLEHYPTYASFLQAVEHLCHLFGVAPEVVAHDLHPEYLSTKFATEFGLPTHPVQHHHAHIASCLVDHGEPGPVLGIAFDGLGFGSDGTLWGGEFLVADLGAFERVGHLRPAPLPGGAAAIREPWRMAVSWIGEALGRDTLERIGPRLDDRWAAVAQVATSDATLVTTSAGRLFDAVSALLGIRGRVTYEGQAAIELEARAHAVAPADAPVYPVDVDHGVLDPAPLLAAMLDERRRGVDVARIAAGFHAGLAAATVRLATELARQRQLHTVALSGGVFQNVRLTHLVADQLREDGFGVLVHRSVPANDGGIAIGQAAIASRWRGP
ncbi:MAG: carbamoyltransferase HypF [Actinomycetota bacterium]|nr:carbamoyltransferase HypF [Actinomycetota bacterium]